MGSGISIALTIILVGTLQFLPVSSSAQSKERVIHRLFQRPIADRLLPDDEVVKVNQNSDFAEPETEPTFDEALDNLIVNSRHIAAVDVQEVVRFLVEDGDWIRTRLSGVIVESFTSSGDRHLTRGQPIEMEASGGELRIGKVLVRTDDAIPLRAKRRYLVFLNFAREWDTFHTRRPIPIENARLVIEEGMLEGIDPRSPNTLHGMTLNTLRQRVRRLSKQP